MQNLSPHAEICEQRAIGLWRLATQQVPITILPVASALLRIEPGDFYRQLALKLRVGDELPLEEVIAHLESIGYERREPVEMVGEYSVRGGILDVFSPESDQAGAHRSVRRPGGIHPPVRRGIAALGAQGRRLHAAAAHRVSEVARRCWWNLASCCRRPAFPGAICRRPARPFPAGNCWLPMVRPRQCFGLFAARPADRALGRAGAGAGGRRPVLEAAGADRRVSAAYDPDGSSSAGRNWSARPPPAPQLSNAGTGDRLGDPSGRRSFTSPRGRRWPSTATCRWPSPRRARWWKPGNRVAFFASSTGEVERVADILNEYGVPYQLGLEQIDSTPAYLAERAYMAGVGRQHLSGQRADPARHGVPGFEACSIWLRRSVRDLRTGGAGAVVEVGRWPPFPPT